MSSSQATYQGILNDLNRDVARAQPVDVWQFCANWFNSKLEEQRSQNRTPPSTANKDTRSQSLPATAALAGNNSGSMRKKTSVPSLAGSGYTFGQSPTASQLQQNSENLQSPYTENGPSLTNVEQPPNAFLNPKSRPTMAPSPLKPSSGSNSNLAHHSSSSSSSGWTKSFNAPATQQSVGIDKMDEDEDEDDVYDPRDMPSSNTPTTPIGIPLSYNLGRRTSVSAESLDPSAQASLPKTVIPKSHSQRMRIESSIKGNLLFRNLDEDQYNDVLSAMKEVQVPRGTEVIVQGAVGDFFYVVETGQFEVWVKPPQTHSYDPVTKMTKSDNPPAKMVACIDAGGSFGELALMYNAPRAATVVAVSSNSTLWALDRVTFRSILMEHTSRKRKMYEVFLSEVGILSTLEPHERAKIADALEEKVYEDGEAVVIEGEVGKNFYIIESGAAEVTKRRPGASVEDRVSALGKGDYFGELALLNSAPRAATVRAVGGRLKVATLGEKAFTRLLGPVTELLQRRAERQYGAASASASNSRGNRASADSPALHTRNSERSLRNRASNNTMAVR